ncbi:MAG TPA: DUF2062 domain-containing protein [Chthoniobacterales bacterium]
MKYSPLEFLRMQWRKVLATGGTREAVARGVALGVGLGFTPLFGLKTLLALLLAPAVRGNRTAALVGTTLHDVLLPLAPALLRLEYDLGYWLLHRPHRWPAAIELHHVRPHDWLSWTTFLGLASPLLVGSLLVAAPISLVSYFVVRRVWPAHDAAS